MPENVIAFFMQSFSWCLSFFKKFTDISAIFSCRSTLQHILSAFLFVKLKLVFVIKIKWHFAIWKCNNIFSNENAFLLSQLHDVGVYLLIGLTDNMYEGTYLWTDQSSVDYTNWYRYYYYGPTTDCGYFHAVNGKWVNRDCKTETGFICQKRKYCNCIYELFFFKIFYIFLLFENCFA